MKRISFLLAVVALVVAIPVTIKTQWDFNGFLSLTGSVAVEDASPWSLSRLFGIRPLKTLHYADVALKSGQNTGLVNQGWTVEGWFCLDEASQPATFLTVIDGTSAAPLMKIAKQRGNRFEALIRADGKASWQKLDGVRVVAAGEWIHFALVLPAASDRDEHLQFYLAGERLASVPNSVVWQWPQHFTMRFGSDGTNSSFSGKLDDIRISAAARYHDLTFFPNLPLASDSQTVALWSFDGSQALQANETLRVQSHWQVNTPGTRFVSAKARPLLRNHVAIEWQTELERQLRSFEVQRRSADAHSEFREIARVPAVGNSNIPQQYQFVDQPPTSGRYYFRLKCIDIKGNIGYSDEFACDFGLND